MRFPRYLGIGVLTLLLGLILGSAAPAQAIIAPKVKNREKAELLKELHAAHKLLAEADRDYDGHRAKAALEVHKAIKELGGRLHLKKGSTTPTTPTAPPAAKTTGKLPAVREPQAVSDGQLNQARSILQGLQTELSAHHPKAGANVTAAIAEIDTALKIK
jgi:hypothetical protein